MEGKYLCGRGPRWAGRVFFLAERLLGRLSNREWIPRCWDSIWQEALQTARMRGRLRVVLPDDCDHRETVERTDDLKQRAATAPLLERLFPFQ